MSKIFFDTNILIYFFEAGPFTEAVRQIIQRMEERGDALLTSTMAIAELLVKPRELGNRAVADKYLALLDTPSIQVVPFDRQAIKPYADIRQDRSIRGADAIQLACAAAAGTDLFLTNDAQLARKIVPGIQFIVTLDRIPF